MIDKQYIIERSGKQFVLYAGLLALAHEQGLRRISTEILQVPSEENGQTAIVHATVETERGTFDGIGDASPANVSRQMLSVTIRLAETRAKSRALRDSVNVWVAALEELGEEPAPGPTPIDRTPPKVEEPATVSQRRAIARLGSIAPEQLSKVQASALISRLQKERPA